jgi:dTDP-4-dehydrorhamnose reductase
MLGNACMDILGCSSDIELIGTARSESKSFIKFDARTDSIEKLLGIINPDWIVNCIGIIKPHIDEKVPESIENAIKVNSEFPILLAGAAQGVTARVLQIATDCVYSGVKGSYMESDLHDATDVYGKTKSLGEVPIQNVMHIRASIIGPEVGRSTSLLEWFRNQEVGAKLNGFTDHLWNGVTTHAFGKLCLGIIKKDAFVAGGHHVIPGDVVSKAELLRIFAKTYNRLDVVITDVVSSKRIDRTLGTNNLELSNQLWLLAGYKSPPTVEEMVLEQADLLTA